MNQLFSLVIANYNNGNYIEEAINSVLNQTFQNLEIIIIDDASTDNSIEIITPFLSDKRFKLIRNKTNSGVGYTKKTGIETSTGQIIGILDPDDTLTPNAIEIMVKAHTENPDAALVYSTHYLCDEDLNIKKISPHVGEIPENETYLTLKDNFNHHISQFATFKKKYYDATGGISEKYLKAIDKDLYFKLEEVGKTLFIPQPLYYYRWHKGSISLFANAETAYEWELFAKKEAFIRRTKQTTKNLTINELIDLYVENFNKMKNKTQNLQQIIQQKDEIIQNIYNSSSYKIGNLFLKPFSFFKKILK